MDFKKKLSQQQTHKILDPSKIYDSLDRASDKGPLRPAQEFVLAEWHAKRRGERDLLVKLQTGQGKTLIGLLMLQSRLNEGKGPAAYLCANPFLADQTMRQAREFGFKNFATDPHDAQFQDGRQLLISTIKTLFNGKSRFGLRSEYQTIGTLLLDDAHACADEVRESYTISIRKENDLFSALLLLFEEDLKHQGAGTFEDVKNGKRDARLAVPYWAWRDRHDDVTRFLGRRSDSKELEFIWPILKDSLIDCSCVFSGAGLEITPYTPDLSIFPSYWKAPHRILMSATITNDAFLIKGLGLSPQVITSPLTHEDDKWYGEKMVIIPSLIDPLIDRDRVIKELGKPKANRTYGTVVLTSSFNQGKKWQDQGSVVVDYKTITQGVQRLREKNFAAPLVIVNRYDGIDLPDDNCRVLILDSKPFAEGVTDTFLDECRPSSEITSLKLARTIEQGIGRAVRGEKDYCVVVIVGPNLIKALRSGKSKLQFSAQTQAQVNLGLEIADMSKEEIGEGVDPWTIISTLLKQSISRDDGWKEFYAERMSGIAVTPASPKMLDIFRAEQVADEKYLQGDHEGAVTAIQTLIDKYIPMEDKEDRGWYLQETARYLYPISTTRSNDIQIKAHRLNHLLLKPKSGVIFERLIIQQKRVEQIKQWLSKFESNEAMLLAIEAILSDLNFGVDANDFEEALHQLGFALGFGSQRPDKEWKEGPDNLWALRDGEYLLMESKDDVDESRTEIFKNETGQINNACAWFKLHYPGAKVKNLMLIPTKKVSKAAGFNDQVEIMQKKNLKRLKENVRRFFLEFKQLDLHDLDAKKIQGLLTHHLLEVDDITSKYSELPVLTV